MSDKHCIGDDLREAIDWLQDLMETTRPMAEIGMITMLREGAARTTETGIILIEDEEETKREFSKRGKSKGRSKGHNLGKYCYKHHSKSSKHLSITNSTDKAIRKGANGYSNAANDMIEAETGIRFVGHDEMEEK